MKIQVVYWALLLALICCNKKKQTEPIKPIAVNETHLEAEPGEEFSGGDGTVFSVSKDAFGFQAPNIPTDLAADFSVGNSFFRLPWVIAPSSTRARDGLGPMLNANSCGACHGLDGRGSPMVNSDGKLTSMLIRMSIPGSGVHGDPIGVPNYGDQLNDKSISGVMSEGNVEVTYTEEEGSYSDGTKYSLRKPAYQLVNLAYGIPAGVLTSPRVAPQLPGLGLLEAIDDATIYSLADPIDADGDGISGRVNIVWDVAKKSKSVGKFGWKSNQPNLHQQTAGAFNGDMGITSSLFPEENLSGVSKLNYDTITGGGNPEVSDSLLHKIVLYCQTLGVPARRNWNNKTVLKGKQVFNNIGCTSCHIPKITTGNASAYPAFRQQTIRPYTDLLLHDMGVGLADGRPDFEASGVEWRTPPLWGIGLIKVVNNHTFFLHDGRARNVEEAILWHGGEAKQFKNKFVLLPKAEREELLKFLDSL